MQTRTGSTRLPGKVLLNIHGKSMMAHIIERLQYCKKIDEIIVATTIDKKDDIIESTAHKLGVSCFRGDENDVLRRYFEAAEEFKVNTIVRITSDCPLVDPAIIDNMMEVFIKKTGKLDYLSNTLTFPRGLDVEIFTFDALKKAFMKAGQKYEREHVTPYLYQHSDIFRLQDFRNETDFSPYRLTVDTQPDFELIVKIYENLYLEGEIFLLDEIMRLLKQHPELTEINKEIQQKSLHSNL